MTPSLAIKYGTLLTGDQKLQDGYIVIEEGKISKITEQKPGSMEILDYSGSTIVPGLIDLHTHGYCGIDSMIGHQPSLLKWSVEITSHGVTGMVPTSVSETLDKTFDFISTVKKSISQYNGQGAEIIGCRLEGPYISKEKKGAHNAEFLREPTEKDIMSITESGKDVLRIVDIAPEISGAIEAISLLRKTDIVVSGGHSNASFNEASMGVQSGISLFTHFYNAMSGLKHREVGMVGAGFLLENVKLELITDLIHVSPEAIRIAVNSRGWKNIVLVTDSISATGLGDGEYMLGSTKVTVDNGKCVLKGTETIAGSTLTMDQGIRNMVSIGYRLEDVIGSATVVPAGILGLSDRGSLKIGFRADLCILDQGLNVERTFVNGASVFSREDTEGLSVT